MYTEIVEYTDFDDNEREAKVYFNLNKSEMLEQIHIVPELQAMLAKMQKFGRENPDATELPMELADEVRHYVKLFMKLSYGVKGETADGIQTFRKSEEIWNDFMQTAVYDKLLIGLLTDAARSAQFFADILPKDLREEAAVAEVQQMLPVPTEEKTYKDYTREQLVAMPQAQLDALVGTDPTKWPREVMMVQYQRKAGG